MPPERRERAVYAPALVAFVGGTELGVALGAQNRRPVGWFPLGPREAYVPPYTADRAYYQRINANARVPDATLNDRWQRAERHEALQADRRTSRWPTAASPRWSRPTTSPAGGRSSRPACKVAADKVAAAPVAAVAAPPAPTMALAAQPANRTAQPAQPQAQAANRPGQPAAGQPAIAQTRFANMETIARPAPTAAQPHAAPGPRIVSTTPTAPGAKAALPQLAPNAGNAPAPGRPGEPARPNEQRPGQPPQANQAVQPAHPGEPPRPERAASGSAAAGQPARAASWRAAASQRAASGSSAASQPGRAAPR